LKSYVTTPRIDFTWQEIDDLDLVAQFMGLSIQNIAGVVVSSALQAVVNPSAYLQFIKIANQNGDGSTIVVNSVTGSIDGLLVVDTNYNIVQDSDWVYGIQLISGGSISTLTQTFTIDYDYTPSVSKQMTYKIQDRTIPFQLFRFTECLNEAGEANVYYLVKAAISSEVVQNFVNLERNDFAGSPMTFTGEKGWNFFEKKLRLTDMPA